MIRNAFVAIVAAIAMNAALPIANGQAPSVSDSGQSDTPKTASEAAIQAWDSAKRRFEAEKATLDAEVAAIEAREALKKARNPDPVSEDLASQITKANATKALADAQKATADARLAALRAQIGEVPESGYSGEVAVGKNAGETEAALLAAKAVDRAAQEIANRMPEGGNVNGEKQKLLLYAAVHTPDFRAYLAFNTQLSVVEYVLNNAIFTSDKTFQDHPKTEPMKGRIVPRLSAVGLSLNAVNKILGFFRTDYSINPSTVTFEDSLLVHALAKKTARRGYDVLLPSIFNSAVHSATLSDVINKITKLVIEQQSAIMKSKSHRETANSFNEQSAKDGVSDDLKESYDNKAKAHTEASESLDSAAAVYDAFFSRLTTISDGKTPLSDVLLEAELVRFLKEDARLLIVKIEKVGGAHYTKKNIGTLFGAMPLYHMGGAVVSFVLLRGSDGRVERSGVVPVHGGFMKANQIRAYLESPGGSP